MSVIVDVVFILRWMMKMWIECVHCGDERAREGSKVLEYKKRNGRWYPQMVCSVCSDVIGIVEDAVEPQHRGLNQNSDIPSILTPKEHELRVEYYKNTFWICDNDKCAKLKRKWNRDGSEVKRRSDCPYCDVGKWDNICEMELPFPVKYVLTANGRKKIPYPLEEAARLGYIYAIKRLRFEEIKKRKREMEAKE